MKMTDQPLYLKIKNFIMQRSIKLSMGPYWAYGPKQMHSSHIPEANLGWHQFSSVAQSCPTPCNPTDCRTPSLPVHLQLPELTETHVHWVKLSSNHLILCHPLLLPTLIFPSITVFSSDSFFTPGGQSIAVSDLASDLPMNIQDWFPLYGLVGCTCSLREFQESSPTPQFKSIIFSVHSFHYSPTLTSIHDYWKNNSFE